MDRITLKTTPPPLPQDQRRSGRRRRRVLIGLAIVACLLGASYPILRSTGLIRPFRMPTQAMAPTLAAGDHIMMERLSFLWREPRRGDIVVFVTDGIAGLPQGEVYMKRIAGESGEHVRISKGTLYIDDVPISLRNALGELTHEAPPEFARFARNMDVIVPQGHFFVLGDNSANSSDSRIWGCVPRENIIGRIAFCYWPPNRIGCIR